MVNSFNKHFISSGSIFNEIPDCNIPNPSPPLREDNPTFSLSPIPRNEVLKALKNLDIKSAGPDEIDPFFLKAAAEIIAGPLAHIFN